MDFDRFTIALLIHRDDAPRFDEDAENALQDAHMAHLADLHQAGHLLAAGPLLGEPDRAYCGLSILAVDPGTGAGTQGAGSGGPGGPVPD